MLLDQDFRITFFSEVAQYSEVCSQHVLGFTIIETFSLAFHAFQFLSCFVLYRSYSKFGKI